MRALIFHSLRMRKIQTASIFISIALSVALVFVLALVYGGVTRGMELSSERNGADLLVVPKDARSHLADDELLYTGIPAPLYMDEGIVADIAALDGVERATAQFFSQTLNASCCSATDETRLIGVDFATDFVVQPLLPADFTGALEEDEVVVGSQVDGIADGVLNIYGEPYRVVATMAESGGDLDHSIIMGIDEARRISAHTVGLGSTWERYGDPMGLISCILVDAADDEGAYEKLKIKLNLTDGVAYVENAETAEKTQEQLKGMFALLAGAALIMIVVALLQLFARFYSCVWDRKSELALYRAIGASKSEIRALIGGEVGIITSAGIIFGLVLGAALTGLVLALMLDSVAFPYVGLDGLAIAGVVAGIIILFAAIAALSIIWPLQQVGRIDPSLAMQQGDID